MLKRFKLPKIHNTHPVQNPQPQISQLRSKTLKLTKTQIAVLKEKIHQRKIYTLQEVSLDCARQHSYSMHQELSHQLIKTQKDLQKYSLCDICQSHVKKDEIISISKQCGHEFCATCLMDYATYKITVFQEVICPQQKCNKQLTKQHAIFQNLSEQMKKLFIKISNFQNVVKNPHKKLCPKQFCSGVITFPKKEEANSRCNQCLKKYCKICMNKAHKGKCDQNIILKLQKNLGFKKCSNCKMMVEKNKGCDHITCKCGNQFCYLCGGSWQKGKHKCPKQSRLKQEQFGYFEALNQKIQTSQLTPFQFPLFFIRRISSAKYILQLRQFCKSIDEKNNQSINILKTLLFFFLVYPLSLIVACFHFVVVFILFPIFQILKYTGLFLICKLPKNHYRDFQAYFEDREKTKMVLMILGFIFLPISIFVIGCAAFIYGWYRGQNGSQQKMEVIGKKLLRMQLRSNIILLCSPYLIFKFQRTMFNQEKSIETKDSQNK